MTPRVSSLRLRLLLEELTPRYTAPLPHLARARLLTGAHLDRLLTAPDMSAETTARVRRRIMTRLSGAGLVTMLARRVASSRRQLQRAYSEIGNTTFRDQLTQVRMRRAAELLTRRSVTVREVARRVGYRQPAQFAKAFRRTLGVAPSDYRTRLH